MVRIRVSPPLKREESAEYLPMNFWSAIKKTYPLASIFVFSILLFALTLITSGAKIPKLTLVRNLPDILGKTVLGKSDAHGQRPSVFSSLTGPLRERKEFKPLKKSLNSKSGTYGLYIKNLDTGEDYRLNETHSFYGASLYKLPIAVATVKALENGSLISNQTVEYLYSDYYTGSGIINRSPFGTSFTISELLSALVKNSDNVAQSMLRRTLGEDVVMSTFHMAPVDPDYYIKNIVSPWDTGVYLEEIHNTSYINEKSKSYLLGLMSVTDFDDRISQHLNSHLTFSHKIGSGPEHNSWHDCGVVSGSKNLTLCLMSENTTYAEFLEAGREVAEFVNSL
jgi:hypothetical protein